jgi:hypothetical protein
MPVRSDNKALRAVLLVDAATCVLAGAVMTLGAELVNGFTDIPRAVLLPAGLSLFPIAAFMAFVATRAVLSKPAVWLIIAGNAAWVIGSLYLAMGSAIAPNPLGQVFIGAQAAAVAILTVFECRALAQMQGEFA